MKADETTTYLKWGKVIAGIVLVAVVIYAGMWYYVNKHLAKGINPMYTVTPTATPAQNAETPLAFTVSTPMGFFRDDSYDNISIFAENRWKDEAIHHPSIAITQYPGLPPAGDLSAFVRAISDPVIPMGEGIPKDCSDYIKALAELNDDAAMTVQKHLTLCWFYGVKKVEKMSSIGGFPTVKFSTQNVSTRADNVGINVTSGGKHYFVVISAIATGLSDDESDRELKRAMTEIIKNITFIK